jgi:hypothetical protein
MNFSKWRPEILHEIEHYYLVNRQTSGESASLPQYDEGTESAEVATCDYLVKFHNCFFFLNLFF